MESQAWWPPFTGEHVPDGPFTRAHAHLQVARSLHRAPSHSRRTPLTNGSTVISSGRRRICGFVTRVREMVSRYHARMPSAARFTHLHRRNKNFKEGFPIVPPGGTTFSTPNLTAGSTVSSKLPTSSAIGKNLVTTGLTRSAHRLLLRYQSAPVPHLQCPQRAHPIHSPPPRAVPFKWPTVRLVCDLVARAGHASK